MTDNILVVVGLGNPGPDYAGNRHNVGQMVLDELASRMGATFKKHKTPNQVAEGRLVPGGTRLVLAKPGSFMNTSGGPVSSVLGFYSATPADLVVVHDELDLPFDTVRLKGSGGHGGHNGLRDIIKATGTNEFMRVRVGIGRPPGRQDPADYVLRDFSAAEKKTLPILLADAADAVQAIAEVGLLAAQQRVHAPS
ncbi:aminoacyl-tRNA hydrolase [Curtobacterium flaccumfaciens]|uniref:aminoacyl-tRNA hydrolase n=1 Tax=Curtobacterium flaccumfaciens TaxID=2035 RepID=UPI00188D3D98|nr:aminoacyl-tRNA hydrolase [Curtobacterium flaccumfaciens]MBF4592495.1 aminoacyl-tRNA hydrolase [Curtobacterium flaccumfaciens]MBO9046650.1 aminoacyl-tRNA hydrolase [Curtobacterium flaccumfaciens pv. flaccumfaciens]MBO9051070.1 aminoacyl-tRNA hydrolase [Curtobacterium flaccumfaciens pv. flaccumfaciens]MBO9056209.1 aminoacyl-tRNA hydrolase [Curtobacterium flaccumfaciens pv. flaccumfaciens]MCS6550568.1 aminoacyl-tRNA hydrolase [Curtobacterium flaccumfaciens pv. flaccumfaciens]